MISSWGKKWFWNYQNFKNYKEIVYSNLLVILVFNKCIPIKTMATDISIKGTRMWSLQTQLISFALKVNVQLNRINDTAKYNNLLFIFISFYFLKVDWVPCIIQVIWGWKRVDFIKDDWISAHLLWFQLFSTFNI